MNLPRVRLQKSIDYKIGIKLANSKKELPLAVYDATSFSSEQAKEAHKRGNRVRWVMQEKAKLGWKE